MAFKCGECGHQFPSREYVAEELHKLTHVILDLSKGLQSLGLIPTSSKDQE